ncbi:MAG: substrate-binding periplasmic protein [Desulfobulbus sp.]
MKTIIISIIFVLLFSFHVPATEISFLTHSLQGQAYFDKKGELRGKEHAGKRAFYLEVVREMMVIMKHPRKIEEYPFIRGLRIVQKDSNRALFNVSKIPEREGTVKWVGPILVEKDYFYEMKNSPTGVTSLEDAKNVDKICVLNGGVHHNVLLKNEFSNLITNISYVNCFKMLKNGRVNLTISASDTVSEKLKEAGMELDQIKQIPFILLESGGYIAFSNNISDNIIQKWQDTFDLLKKSGKYQLLYKLYFLPE